MLEAVEVAYASRVEKTLESLRFFPHITKTRMLFKNLAGLNNLYHRFCVV